MKFLLCLGLLKIATGKAFRRHHSVVLLQVGQFLIDLFVDEFVKSGHIVWRSPEKTHVLFDFPQSSLVPNNDESALKYKSQKVQILHYQAIFIAGQLADIPE